MRRFEALIRGIEALNRYAGLLSGVIALAMMVTISREAIGRYFFNSPTDWVVELNGYLLVGMVFLSGGYILLMDGHLRVDILYTRWARGRIYVDLASCLLALPYLSFIIWQGGLQAWQSFMRGDTSLVMEWPLFLPEAVVPVGASLLALQFLARLVRLVRLLTKGPPGA